MVHGAHLYSIIGIGIIVFDEIIFHSEKAKVVLYMSVVCILPDTRVWLARMFIFRAFTCIG
jgi:glucose dehydrogenase